MLFRISYGLLMQNYLNHFLSSRSELTWRFQKACFGNWRSRNTKIIYEQSLRTLQGRFSEITSIYPLVTFCIYINILLLLFACSPTPQINIDRTKTINPEESIIAYPSETIKITSETITNLQSTPESTRNNKLGQLFIHNVDGIQQVTLSDRTQDYLLTREADWLDWGASFAQNQKHVAYWIRGTNGTELWFTNLTQWHPVRILNLDNSVKYDFATILWGVNDRYLLLSLSILDHSGPLEDIKTIRTYIVDTKTLDLVNQTYWPGNCSILAYSTQSNNLALWCHADEQQEFLVLESEEYPWTTQQEPNSLINNCLILYVCAWSPDGEFITFIVTEGFPHSLFYLSTTHSDTYRVDVEDASGFPAWSPNSQFISYAGDCVNGGFQCPTIISVAHEEIIWRAKSNNNHGEFGVIFADHLIWSPNSQYIAMPVLIETESILENKILIIDIVTQEASWLHYSHNKKILDIVWVID